MPCPSKFTPALGSPDERQPANTPRFIEPPALIYRILINAKFFVKDGSSMSTDSVQSAPVLVWPLMVLIQNVIASPNNFRELTFTCARVCETPRPCQFFSGFASQVGDCKLVLVILIIHERRNLLRWRWT
jgi:hypothetical protein